MRCTSYAEVVDTSLGELRQQVSRFRYVSSKIVFWFLWHFSCLWDKNTSKSYGYLVLSLYVLSIWVELLFNEWFVQTSSPRSDCFSGTRLNWAHLLLIILEYVSNSRKVVNDRQLSVLQMTREFTFQFLGQHICSGYSKEPSRWVVFSIETNGKKKHAK